VRPLIHWMRSSALSQSRRCLFLDRDGVLNEHIQNGYVLRWEDFLWRPGVIASLARLSEIALPIVIVTNQSCIGRDLVSADSIMEIMDRVVTTLQAAGVWISAWYCCPHTPQEDCLCRKPSLGMLYAAAGDLNIDLRSSYLIGDSDSDIAAGKAVGCRTWKVGYIADFHDAINEVIACQRNAVLS
jgi:histidinol-phosphate phosphatase family protein